MALKKAGVEFIPRTARV